MYVFAFQFEWLPIFGGYSAGATPALTWTFLFDMLRHAMLPALGKWLGGVDG